MGILQRLKELAEEKRRAEVEKSQRISEKIIETNRIINQAREGDGLLGRVYKGPQVESSGEKKA